MKGLLKALFVAMLALSFVAVGCEEKKEDTKKEEKADKEKKADEPKADEAKAEEPAAEEPKAEEPAAPVLELEEMDLTAKAKETWPAFEGTVKMSVLKGVALEPGMGCLKMKLDKIEMELCTAAPTIEEMRKKWEANDSFTKDVKIITDETNAVLAEGSAMGSSGHFVYLELKAADLNWTCRTATGRFYDKAAGEKILEACKTLVVE